MSRNWPDWMISRIASEYLAARHGVQAGPGTLNSYRCKGIGPKFEYRGKFAVYSAQALDEWVAERSTRQFTSASEANAARAAAAA